MRKPFLVLAVLLASFHTMADEPPASTTEQPGNSAEQGLWSRDNLLGDLGGLRPQLGQVGIGINLEDVSGIWGNLGGGLRRGDVYNGAATLSVNIDFERAVGWEGARAFASAEWLSGRSPILDLVASLQQVHQLDIGRGGLLDLWFEQTLLQHRLSVRVGQERPDEEFLLSPYGQVMLNSTLGWPGMIDANIPTHNAEPMIRVLYNFSDQVRLLAGAFNGGADRGTLAIGELQYTQEMNSYRFGGWYQTGSFRDQVFETWIHHGGSGIYASADQMVWRKADDDRGIAVFVRVLGGSTLTNLQIDGGINWKGAIPGEIRTRLG